jgi:murein DD-endopeptidase MepM/ murein hydrolase activator NlpD
VRIVLSVCCLFAVAFVTTAAAQQVEPVTTQDPNSEMTNPRVASVNVDWDAVRAALAGFETVAPHDDAGAAPPPADTLTRLNAATGKIFANVAASPVPVLLPFDTATYLSDEAAGTVGDRSKYFAGLDGATLFFPGPSGYDAALSLRRQAGPGGLTLTFADRIDVQISGSSLVYELEGPSVPEGTAVPELESQYPGIRRVLLESHLRYTFVRFGVPYFVSILCNDGPNRARRLSCREADKVAVHVLQTLNIVGGKPEPEQASNAPHTIARPDKVSPDFTYYAPGDLMPGSGMRGQSGRADSTVYAKIRFPIAQQPAYANSQSFMSWGDCDHTGRVGLGGRGLDGTYRCRVNSRVLYNDESKNFAYPWRDNFCEHRYWHVGQCPAGLGHQGQDIRPGSCLFRAPGAGRCDPYQHDVVAVRDGVLMRSPGDRALYLVVDQPGEHVRFRYLHMNPQMLDETGMISGRQVTEGQVLGAVGNFDKHSGGTSYHLHLDLQVPTRAGWVFVSPYMTLVAAYERLIGGRGQLVKDAAIVTAATGPAAPAGEGQTAGQPTAGETDRNSAEMSSAKPGETSTPAPPGGIVASRVPAESSPEKAGHESKSEPTSERQSERRAHHSERRERRAEHCATRMVKGHRRRLCGTDVAEGRGRGKHAHSVRTVDRHVSHESRSARHHGRDVHPRHARGSSRHHRA